jgi:O-antigen/teichoic acid export membrane protein
VSATVEFAPALPRRRGALLRRVAAYGLSRGATEGMLAARGILLAALLGPAAFGSWALLRLGMRYAALGGLGISRGLEFELLHPSAGRQEGWRAPAGVALGFVLAVAGSLAAAALAASFVVAGAEQRLLLRGFAAASVAESAYGYALACTRVRKTLRHYAALEAGTAALHLAAAVGLAQVGGLAGAFAGLALANLAGLGVASRWVELRPRWNGRTLRRLLGLGVPIALTNVVAILLLTADRWIVAGWGGATLLGYYAFAGSVATAATALAVVVRTVVFADVYGEAQAGQASAAVGAHLERAVLPFARLLPPLLGALGLAVGPLVAAVMPKYVAAIPAARLFFLGGAAMGTVNLATLGAVAAGHQRRLPLYGLLGLAVSLGLAVLALGAGLGLEGVAGASVAGFVVFAAAVLRLDVHEAGVAAPNRFVATALLPVVWCAAAVAAAGRVAGHDVRSTAAALALYALLLVPLSPAWRDDWRRLRR